MSAIERRLSEALTGGATQVEPAPDLFARCGQASTMTGADAVGSCAGF